MNNKYHYEVIEGKKKRVYDTPPTEEIQEETKPIEHHIYQTTDNGVELMPQEEAKEIYDDLKETTDYIKEKRETKPTKGEQLWEDLKKYYRENPRPKNHLISKLFLSLLIISISLVLGYFLAYLLGMWIVG
jgi:hypothetical protein